MTKFGWFLAISSAINFSFLLLNVWCIATNQPSSLHLNGVGAIINGVVSFICFFLALGETK